MDEVPLPILWGGERSVGIHLYGHPACHQIYSVNPKSAAFFHWVRDTTISPGLAISQSYGELQIGVGLYFYYWS